MAEWTYYAGSRATLEAGLEILDRFGVMWRGSRNRKGGLVANVGNLRPGDTIDFVYRDPDHCRSVFRATIGEPIQPAAGTSAIDRIGGDAAKALVSAGYPGLDDGTVEVIRLTGVERTAGAEVVPQRGQNALWQGTPKLAKPSSQDRPSLARREDLPRQTKPPARAAGARPRPAASPRAVDSPTEAGRRGAAHFDRYVAVDWSAAAGPVRGASSIWIAAGRWREDGGWWIERAPRNCSTRAEALECLEELLGSPGRTLVGLDFAFGYPAGFAASHGMGGRQGPDESAPEFAPQSSPESSPESSAWLRTARHLLDSIEDSSHNQNNRHAVAAAINRATGGGPGPFWGCHEGAASDDLMPRRKGWFEFPYRGLEEYRLTDRRVIAGGTPILSVWKIDQGVSVGGQTLMGIPYLMMLRQAVRARGRGFEIWPFETGWQPSGDGVTAAELFPSLLAGPTPPAEIRDRHQVRQCVRRLAEIDSRGELVSRFARPSGLSDDDEVKVRTEEGWILLA